MVNYHNGKIYKIECNKTGLVYIGSTCQPTLARRLAEHRANYKSYLNGKQHYVSSFKILENNDYNIILIENCPCDNKDELYSKERYWINNMNCVNKIKNIGLINEVGVEKYNKQYCEANKEKLKEQKKEYREENKEKKKEYDKQRYEANKEKIKEKEKEYYEANKEKINEKFECDCGGRYTHINKSKHLKSKIHQNYINNLAIEKNYINYLYEANKSS